MEVGFGRSERSCGSDRTGGASTVEGRHTQISEKMTALILRGRSPQEKKMINKKGRLHQGVSSTRDEDQKRRIWSFYCQDIMIDDLEY